MILLRKLRQRRAAWRSDEDGSVAVETILMVPLLSWALLATLTYFDAYRSESINAKAGLTIADMISRETDHVNDDYIDGAYGLLKFLTLDDEEPYMRISAYRWHVPEGSTEGSYQVRWSKVRGSDALQPLTDANLANFKSRLPNLSNGERMLLVETWTSYETPYGIGLEDFTMSTFDVISPRFAPRTCWNATPDQGADTAIC